MNLYPHLLNVLAGINNAIMQLLDTKKAYRLLNVDCATRYKQKLL